MNICTYYYNINNIFKFNITGRQKKLKYIDKQYCYFRESKKITDVDLEVYVGDFKSPVNNKKYYEIVHNKYIVTSNSMFCHDNHKVAKWKVLIKNLDCKLTQVYFCGNIWSSYMLYKYIIESIFRYKINQKGYLCVHAAAVNDNNGAVVFASSPGVGKTTSILNWINCGSDFISDEFTILGSEKVYSYPTPLRVHEYNLKTNPFMKKNMSLNDKLQIFFRSLLYKLTFGYGVATYEMNIWDIFPKLNIVDKSKLDKFIIFTKSSGNKIQIKESDNRDKLYRKVLIINKFETRKFNDYISAYYYFNYNKNIEELWDKMYKNISLILKDKKCYEVSIPLYNDKDSFIEIKDILCSLE